MENAALYIRVSTSEQTEFSPDAQKKALLNYAKINNIVVDPSNIFVDEGISGRKAEKRPAFMSMIGKARLKPRPFDVILVHKFDRFARSREDSVVYKTMLLKECGVKVISITESIEDDKFSIILESMLEAMAEYYSINLSEEVKKGMTEKALRGGLQSIACFGYEIKNNSLIIVPEEAKIVSFIFDEYINHDQSCFKIARILNSQGVKTKRGNKIEKAFIEYILQNPVYCGYLRWTPTGALKRNFNNPDSIIVRGKHEPIIPKEIFNKVQDKYKLNKQLTKKNARPSNEYKHWLSGLVHCVNCNGILAHHNNKYPIFGCSNYGKGKCSTANSISVRKLEKLVINSIKKTLDNISQNNYNLNIEPKKKDTSQIESLKRQLERIKENKKRINEIFVSGIDTIEEYTENKKKLHDKEKEIEDKIKKLDSDDFAISPMQLKQSLEDLYNSLLDKDCDKEIKSRMLRDVISKIIYDKPNQSVYIFYQA